MSYGSSQRVINIWLAGLMMCLLPQMRIAGQNNETVAGKTVATSPAYQAPISVPCSYAGCDCTCINSFGYHPGSTCCRNSRIYRSPMNGHFWLGVEYLAWFIKGNELPPLITVSPAGTPHAVAGIIGQPTTSILFGNEKVHDGISSGGRITGGWWFDVAQTSGLEASFFGVDGSDDHFLATGLGDEILARPFYDVASGLNAAELFAFPITPIMGADVTQVGFLEVNASIDLSGAELTYRQLLSCTTSRRTEWLAGYRYGRFDDRLRIVEFSEQDARTATTLTETFLNRSDVFRASSDFHGAQIGVLRNYWKSHIALQLMGKAAIGGTRSRVRVQGGTNVETMVTDLQNPNDPPTQNTSSLPNGLLTQTSNIGSVSNTNFGALVELGAGLEYALSCQLRMNLGYNFVYWSDVARVADHVDLAVDRSQVQPLPMIQLTTNDFWAQGLRLGAVYQF